MRLFSFLYSKFTAVGLTAVWLMTLSSFADLATVHLLNGKSSTIELVAMNRGVIEGKVNSRPDTPVQQFLRSQIDYIDFPTTEAWREAESAFESGKFDEAIALYRAVIADPAAHFFPMPGNFVSLAQVRILESHRSRMVPEDVAKQAQVVREQFLNLPPSYREVGSLVEAWKAVSAKDWEKVIGALEAFYPPTPESHFLKGVALESLGQNEEAMQEYAGAYVLNFGGVSNLTKQALKRSAQLLIKINNKDRAAELQAQVKLYRDLFGGGALWKGAPEWVVKLAEAELDSLKTEVEGDFEKPESSMAEGAVVVSSGAAATIVPLEDRDWLLPNEVRHRFLILGTDPDAAKPVLTGGVVEEENGFRFDGSGSASLGGVNGAADVWRLHLQFIPDATDGAVLVMNEGKVGITVKLVSGEVIFDLSPSQGEKKTWKLGSAPAGKTANLNFLLQASGDVTLIYNKETTKGSIGKRAFRLEGKPNLVFGDVKSGRDGKETPAEGGIIPFKGLISLVVLGSGKTYQEIQSDEKLTFGGKVLFLFPPDPKPAAEPTAPPAKKPAPEPPKEKE